MEFMIDLLESAKGEIIAGIFFALLGWMYNRFRKLTRLYKKRKKELEREKSKKRLPDDDFIELCKSGDARKVEEAIMNDANVNAKDCDGWTALMFATDYSNTKVVEVLLKHGADVNAKTNYGNTALIWAVGRGNTEIAKLLLKHGADVNVKANFGRTALQYAIGRTEMKELLRRYGAKE